MILKSFIAILATSALATQLVRHFGQQHRQRRVRADHRHHHDEVTRWESEGGLPHPHHH